jgi:hypothetical protein
MTQKTDLNVTPYYDDYSESDSYHRVLFRPGFAVQARELTQLQTILQKQIQRFSDHIFREGTIVIPGHIGYDDKYYAVKLQSTFSSAAISSYLSSYDGTIIEGATSGVTAKVIGYAAASGDDPETLFVKYISSNTTDNATVTFSAGENISSDSGVGSYNADAASATTAATSPAATGSAVTLQSGIFYIRGNFVQASDATIVLDKYTNTPSYRVGFTVTETLVTPEDASGLLDNATGATNYAAKGAHRLKITLALAKLSLTSTDDSDFVELLRVENGILKKIVDKTEYSVIERMLARRTYEESGNYSVKSFQLTAREHLDNGTNNGVYTSSAGGDATKLALVCGAGKAFIKGHEIEKISPHLLNINKARTTKSVNNDFIPFNMGNFANVTNIHGSPDITLVSTTQDPFKKFLIYDTLTATRGTASGSVVGVARSRAFEYSSGTAGATSSNATSIYKHYLFDVQMMTNITMSGNVTIAAKGLVTGSTSGATGYLYAAVSAGTALQLLQVEGTFVTGEAITATGTGASTGSVTISEIVVKDFNKDAKQFFMASMGISGADYSADIQLTSTRTLNGTWRTETGTTNATSLLAEALDNSETGIDVDDGSEFAVGQVILVESEQMKISSISTNTLTVTRAFNGTSAATHNDNVQVEILDHLIGVSGYDTSQVQVGDVISIPTGTAGATQDRTVMYVASTYLSFTAVPSTDAITTSDVTRKRAEVKEQEETVMVMKMPHDNISSLLTSGATDTTYTVRRQFQGTTNGSGAVTFTANSGEAFVAHAEKDYTLEILTAGGGGPSGAQSDLVTASTGFVLSGSPSGNTLTITNNGVLGTSAVVKLTATLSVGTKSHKTKTANKTQTVTIVNDGTTSSYDSKTYGHRVGDKEVSIGVTDVYKVHAVYESAAIATTPTLPQITLAASGSYTNGETITGSSSGATGTVIDNTGTALKYVKVTGTFTTSDTISGGTGGHSNTVSAIAAVGDTNILSRFLLDTGQRDSFYDISRLVRKPDQVTPTGQLTIVYSNFSHGTGDYFSADSYSGQIDYGEIPYYIANKIDPDTLAPVGQYPLSSSLDFRPAVASEAVTTTNEPFNFDTRLFEGTGSSQVDLPKVDDNIRADYSYYLPRRDALFLRDSGQFEYIEGTPDEEPSYPNPNLPNAMLIATTDVGAYTYDEQDILIHRQDNRRYTMKDIGLLDRRIKNLEYYTSLGLLETDTQTFQIQDANGLDRFKSGFIVDNFTGHKIGNVTHPDYETSMDPLRHHCRPKAFMDAVNLLEENTTDTERTASGYQKTGNCFTLPYTHTATITQPYATRIEYVNPFNVVTWIGDIVLDPANDTWMDTKTVPSITVNVEGEYDQMMQKYANQLGTVWGSWETVWTGPGHNTGTDTRHSYYEMRQGKKHSLRIGRIHRHYTNIKQKRTGTATQITPYWTLESAGNTVLSSDIIPYMRSRDVDFTITNLKPHTRVYTFFDTIGASIHCRPTGSSAGSTLLNGALTKILTTITVDSTTGFPSTGTIIIGNEQITYTNTTSTTFTGCTRNSNNALSEAEAHADNVAVSGSVNGMPMITDAVGTLTGTFTIPNSSALRFTVGEKEFRVTDSSTDSRLYGHVESSATTSYTAAGTLQTVQETIQNVKRGTLTQQTVESGIIHNEGWSAGSFELEKEIHVGDPLAQSFQVQTEGGEFITKVDVFFSHKDATLPVTLDVRTVTSGYPSRTVLPFSTVTKVPADVNVDAVGTANTATTFTFDSPIYLEFDKEYAIVLRSNSSTYRVWISRVGEIEVGGTRAVSVQPTLGSLFKSQNATTWTASQLEDLKFTLYRAEFDTTAAGEVTLVNEELTTTSGGIKTLAENPIKTALGDATIKINYPNHGMHAASNNVIISGVTSDVTNTLLNGALSNSATTITADSVALFPSAGTIKLDDEIITYTGKTGSTQLTGCIRGTNSTTAATHEDNSVCALYMIAGISLVNVNKTHTAISGIEVDSFTIETGTNATSTIVGGGNSITCTRNISYDIGRPMIENVQYQDTTVTATARTTTGTSVSGSETPFSLTTLADAYSVPLNADGHYAAPQIICSQINETNESVGKSYRLINTLSSSKSTLSPVILNERMYLLTVSNRVDSIDSSSDVGALTEYVDSNQAKGDNNTGVYITDKITLELPATSLKIYFDGCIMSSAEVEVMYKILRTDENLIFDDLGWTYFNTTGIPDSTVPTSKNFFGEKDFKEYEYSADSLEDFISFAIKIVMKSTNSSFPPVIKSFRTIALAT